MIYIIWLVLLSLFVFSFLKPEFPIWVPLVAYLLVVGIRIKQKIGDYKDEIEKNKRDEKIKLEETANDFARRGLTFSGMRNQAEVKVKEDFEYERKRKSRKFWVEMTDTLFLKS